MPNISRCYVLADGECISPLSCPHGDGIAIDRFIMKAEIAASTNDAFNWITTLAVEMQQDADKSRSS